VLDDGAYAPIGDSSERRADLRIVAASNRAESRLSSPFRSRFPSTLAVPPLRERPEDIPLLARQLLLEYGRDSPRVAERFLGTGPAGELEPRVHPRLIDQLVRQPLRGNVFELRENLITAVHSSPGNEVRPLESVR
jgi:transcriptional regulator with AAA-type ATPase domain